MGRTTFGSAGQYGSGMALARGLVLRNPGDLSALALAASGVAIAASPRSVGAALQVQPTSSRGVAETRIGMGGTFAALGLWALARRRTDVYTAVGVTWLGAAAVRGVSLRVDEPETDWTFWAFFAGEVGLGLAGLIGRGRS